MKTKDIYVGFAKDVELRFDTSNYKLDRPLPREESKKVIGLMKDELCGKVITNLVTLKLKTYSYLTENDDESKKAKFTKKVCGKLKNYEIYLEANQLENKINCLENYNIVVHCLKENYKEPIYSKMGQAKLAEDNFGPWKICVWSILEYFVCDVVHVDHLLKTKKEHKIKKKRDLRYIYLNKIGKACFQHDLACWDFKDLPRTTASDKAVRDEAFNIAKNLKYGYPALI